MKKRIEDSSTIDEFLESHIDTEEGLTWYKDRLVAVEKETNGKEVSYRIKFLIAQLTNIKFPEKILSLQKNKTSKYNSVTR